MRFRGLLSAAALLALLAGGVWYSEKVEKEKEGKPAADAPPKIVEISPDQLQQVEILKGADTTALKRKPDSAWEITAPKPLRADTDSVASLVNALNPLNSERLIEEKAANLDSYGLSTPSITVNLLKKDGKATKLLIGDETPTGGGFFAKLDSDPRVFTIASWNKSNFDKSYKDLQDKRLLTFDSDKLSRIELTVKGQTVEFGKNNQSEWQIVRPKPLRADGGNVEDLVRKLRDAKMDTTLSDEEMKKGATAFASAQVVATARATDAAGTQQLEVRKNKDGTYYAKSDAVEGIHKATTDLGDGLNKNIEDFRNKKLFDFGFSDPSKVEIRDGAKSRKLEKAADKWSEAGKEMDSTSVQSLIDKLRDLAAVKFPDTGFSTPIVEATVTSNEGKRIEKVLISQAGEKYIAKRDNEPALYELDKSAVEELLRAAADVKPPEPPKKEDTKKK